MSDSTVRHGVAHGKMIELEQDLGLPEGQQVRVIVQPVSEPATAGAGLRRAFGGWADDAEGLQEYLAWNRSRRKDGRPEVEP